MSTYRARNTVRNVRIVFAFWLEQLFVPGSARRLELAGSPLPVLAPGLRLPVLEQQFARTARTAVRSYSRSFRPRTCVRSYRRSLGPRLFTDHGNARTDPRTDPRSEPTHDPPLRTHAPTDAPTHAPRSMIHRSLIERRPAPRIQRPAAALAILEHASDGPTSSAGVAPRRRRIENKKRARPRGGSRSGLGLAAVGRGNFRPPPSVALSPIRCPCPSGAPHSSRTTSRAALSVLSPLQIGCQSFPSAVHFWNSTCTTTVGSTQCA